MAGIGGFPDTALRCEVGKRVRSRDKTQEEFNASENSGTLEASTA